MWSVLAESSGGALNGVGTGTLIGGLVAAFGMTMTSLWRNQKRGDREISRVERERDLYRDTLLRQAGIPIGKPKPAPAELEDLISDLPRDLTDALRRKVAETNDDA